MGSRGFFDVLGDITKNIWYEVRYCVQINMRYAAVLFDIALPYIMYAAGQELAVMRGGVHIGGEIFLPVLCLALIYYLKEFANKTGKGNTIPIPDRRFTDVDEDGEASVENKRIQEMILYLADLEDWMERKGWL